MVYLLEQMLPKTGRTKPSEHFPNLISIGDRPGGFTAVARNIYVDEALNIAWFDELLSTWMKICRGSGVLKKTDGGQWKIVHYVLSITIPNDNVKEVVQLKAESDDALLKKLKEEKR